MAIYALKEHWEQYTKHILLTINNQTSMKKRFTYLLSLMLMCILGASNAMAADVTVGLTQAIDETNKKLGVVTSTSATDITCSKNVYGANITAYKETASDKKPYIDNVQYTTETHWRKAISDYTDQWVGYTLTIADGKQFNITGVHAMIAVCDDTYNWYVEITNSSDEVLYKSLEKTTKKASTTNFSVSTSDLDQAVQAKLAGIKGTINVRVYVKQGGSTKYFAIPYLTVTGNVEAASAVVTPPEFVVDLDESYEVTVGRSITLTVSAKNADSYQWYNGLTAIAGATKTSYTFTPEAEGTYSIYCAATNVNGSVSSSVAAVTAEPWKPITTARAWDFTKGSTWDAGVKAATTLWGKPSSNRYYYLSATTEEELKDDNGVLKGLEGIYFTAVAEKLLLGVSKAGDNSSCLQFQGDCKMIIPNCNKGDQIYFRFCASGNGKTVSITSDQLVEGASISNTTRTSNATVVVKEAGDIVLNVSNSVRLYEVKVTPYVAVKDIELSTDEVSLEEFDAANVGVKFTPTNATDKTIEWKSSNEAVATVNNGVITAVKAGEAIITATSVDGPSKTLNVTVTATAPKNLSVEMTSNSDAAAPKVESGKTFKLTSNVQGYDLTYQWASKNSANGAWTDIAGATEASYEETAVALGSKFYKVTITNAQGSASQEYEVKTVVPLEAFTVDSVNYKALDADEPQVKVRYQLVRADQETAVNLPDSVVYKGLSYAVKMIGEEAYVNDMTVVSLATPATIEEIGARAFMFCINLTEINLNEGLKKIGDAAFFGCNGLTTVNLPGSIEYLGFKSFSECANLTDIYYDGTKEEWYELPNIEKVGIAKSVTIHFNDGTEENGKGNVVGIDNANAVKAQKDGKYFENGNIVIVKGGKKFNAAGAQMK